METYSLNPILITWKDPGNEIFIIANNQRTKAENGFAVVWAQPGTLFFQFIVDNHYKISQHYKIIIKDGVVQNFIEVDSLPDEISQIKHLTVQEIETIDQELFFDELGKSKAFKIFDYFSQAAEKIYALLKMNAEKKKYKRKLAKIVKIQSAIKMFLCRNRFWNLRLRLKHSVLLDKPKIRVIGGPFRKTLPRVLPRFKEFRKAFGKNNFYQLNIRIKRLPLE